MNILLTQNHDLRSGWKFFAFVILFLILWVTSGIALSVIYARSDVPESQLTFLALNEFALFSAAIGALFLCVRFIDRRPLRTFGIGFLPGWPVDLIAGFAVSAAMLGVLVGGYYILGRIDIHWTGGQFPASTFLYTFALLLLAAATEELVFRGFPLQILVDGLGQWPAVIVMSALFGATHLSNPNASMLSAANTTVAGILLSWAYIRRRSLWLPYAIHAGWNLGLGVVLGFPLSGLHLASLWATKTTGGETILGGAYGPESGLLATFIFASAAAAVRTSSSRLPSNRGHHGAGERQAEE